MKKIFTIGHSTHTLEEFIKMLQSFDIQHLVDVRGLPGSNKYPQFNKENLEVVLPEIGIAYTYLTLLGGRRRVHKDSKNTRGVTSLSALMPTIWRRSILKRVSLSSSPLLKNKRQLICVPKPFGGVVIGR